MTLRFGVDLITFFDPGFWKLDTTAELHEKASSDPAWFWDGVLGAVAAAGIHEIELTFAPADYASGVAAYGSVDGFLDALGARGLGVVSGYFGGLEKAADPLEPATQDQILAEANRYAEFLTRAGGKFLVVGLPMRATHGSTPPRFVDFGLAAPLADLCNRIGSVTLSHGIQTALHTEAHSVFWLPRDIDLFMLLTDPLYVAMCPDTGHIALGGADPVHVMQRHRERLVLAHWKDAVGAVPAGLPIDDSIFDLQGSYFRRAGTGVVDWFGWSRLLRDIGYSGCTLLELDAVADPVAEMTLAREFVTTALSRFYAGAGDEPERTA